jgi:hypothetical protein
LILNSIKVAFYGGLFLPLTVKLQDDRSATFNFFWDYKNYYEVSKQYSQKSIDFSRLILGNFSGRMMVLNLNSTLVNEFRNFDLIITSEDGVISARRSGKPYVFVPLGYDLAQFANNEPRPLSLSRLLRKIYRSKMARAIRDANKTCVTDFPVFRDAIRNLNLRNQHAGNLCPVPIDWEVYERVTEENSSRSEGVFRIFYPNRILLGTDLRDRKIGNTKNSLEALFGYRKFVQEYAGLSELLLIERGNPDDIDRINRWLNEVGLQDFVKWLKPKSNFNSEEMADFYRSCDVVIGDLGSNWFGKTTVESMSQGVPIIGKLESHWARSNGLSDSLILVENSDDVARSLLQLAARSREQRDVDKKKLKELYNSLFSSNAVISYYSKIIRDFQVTKVYS